MLELQLATHSLRDRSLTAPAYLFLDYGYWLSVVEYPLLHSLRSPTYQLRQLRYLFRQICFERCDCFRRDS
jgi:hypothetical protein